MTDTTLVRLKFPLFDGSLQLKRVPKFLRFVCANIASADRRWDALDQLDDKPNDNEQIIAAMLAYRTRIHLDGVEKKTGKRFGKWVEEAVYEPTSVQPDEATLRDTVKWREWCEDRLRKQ